jgi:hypothetical protein
MVNEGDGTAGLDAVRVITSTWPSDVSGCATSLFHVHEKNHNSERNPERINNQQQTEKGSTHGHLESTITVQTGRPAYDD